MCKNWGSVAGGSFLNAFFNIPDLLSDCFKVKIFLFSVILEDFVVNVILVIKIVVAVTMFSN